MLDAGALLLAGDGLFSSARVPTSLGSGKRRISREGLQRGSRESSQQFGSSLARVHRMIVRAHLGRSHTYYHWPSAPRGGGSDPRAAAAAAPEHRMGLQTGNSRQTRGGKNGGWGPERLPIPDPSTAGQTVPQRTQQSWPQFKDCQRRSDSPKRLF